MIGEEISGEPLVNMAVRLARADDTEHIRSVVAGALAEYGLLLDPVLDAPASYDVQLGFRNCGGELWVAQQGCHVVGSAGVVPAPCGAELRALYLRRDVRGMGLGHGLLAQVCRWCRGRSICDIRLWTDSRFTRSHKFYEKMGFECTRETQFYGDINKTTGVEFAATIDEISVALREPG